MRVTVAICTWNRSKLLDHTLSGMHNLDIPPGIDWELLVVNNNCTDDTDEVIARHAKHLPIRRLFERKQGLSNARNAAICAAAGEVIIFTDDDVLVDPDWLAAYVEAAETWPEAAYFGGEIAPLFECEPPGRMMARLELFQGMLGVRDLGPIEKPFDDNETPFGGNMAFRAPILRKRQFDPRLGRRANGRVMAEETELFRHLSQLGLTGVWVPRARLMHFIPKHCFTRTYIWNYFYGRGQTRARLNGVGV